MKTTAKVIAFAMFIGFTASACQTKNERAATEEAATDGDVQEASPDGEGLPTEGGVPADAGSPADSVAQTYDSAAMN